MYRIDFSGFRNHMKDASGRLENIIKLYICIATKWLEQSSVENFGKGSSRMGTIITKQLYKLSASPNTVRWLNQGEHNGRASMHGDRLYIDIIFLILQFCDGRTRKMNLNHQVILLKTCILYLKMSTMCAKYSCISTIGTGVNMQMSHYNRI